MKLNILKCFLFIYFSAILYSCNQKKHAESYYENGTLREIEIKDSMGSKVVYTFFKSGQLEKIEHFDTKNKLFGEKLWFYPSGVLKQKMLFLNNQANGNAYYFYDKKGSLKHSRFYRNDKEVLYGADYWGDSINLMKASLHFNDESQIFYKKNFDEDGALISEEGSK